MNIKKIYGVIRWRDVFFALDVAARAAALLVRWAGC